MNTVFQMKNKNIIKTAVGGVFKSCLLASLMLSLVSCLSIFMPDEEEVRIESNAPSVLLTVLVDGKPITRTKLPATISFKRADNYVLMFQARGYHTTSYTLHSYLKGPRVCASLLMSPFTLGVGFIYDASSDVYYTFPEEIKIRMYPLRKDFAELNLRIRPGLEEGMFEIFRDESL